MRRLSGAVPLVWLYGAIPIARVPGATASSATCLLLWFGLAGVQPRYLLLALGEGLHSVLSE